eukprot:gnl/TRDRNA2_/TRDRNA2_182168_c0_seq1.p1 gnl/TRDRNA2_/TRDRNA2_182168_c0~~gnl/TRDRNA2_/TRDRNA2_182168_c0_seq1.p1  ORF type:complete len:562 (-),score=193.64 gnl/TRDRNA2_/TRDRNA2_182168_c0_seq1:176-1861(-)
MRSLRWLASAALGAIVVTFAEGQEYNAYDEEYKMLMNKMVQELNAVNAQTEAVKHQRLQWEALAAAKEDQARQEAQQQEAEQAEMLPASQDADAAADPAEEPAAAPPVENMPTNQEIDSAEAQLPSSPPASVEELAPPPAAENPQIPQALAMHHRRHFRHFRPRKHHHPQRLRGTEGHHNHGHHKASLYNLQTLLYRAEQEEREDLAEEDRTVQYAADPLPTLPPRYHPLTRRELRRVDGQVKELEARKGHLETEREQLAASRGDATMHLSDAVSIQRAQVQAETKIRKEEHKEQQLQQEEMHLQQEHEQLHERLHRVMDPKIHFATQRLQKEQQLLAKAQMAEGRWAQELAKNKAAAVNKLKTKKQAKARLEASEKAVEEANREYKAAQNAYDIAKQEASQGVELFRVSNTRHNGALAEQQERAAAAQEAQTSLVKMQNVLAMESKQVDNSLAANEKRITGKIHLAQEAREKATKEDAELKKDMVAWKAEERLRADKAAKEKKTYDNNLKAYNSDRTNVYTGAENNAGKKAEVTSDWDWGDWAWAPSDSKVVDDEEVHLD